jgi:hypothetical protein
MAEVVRVAGKTGDGSRLLELRLLEKEAPPFYAAASNVLVMPADGTNGSAGARAEHAAPGAAEVGASGASVHPVTGMPGNGTDAHATGGADAGASGDAAVPGSDTASRSVFLDSSWALDGSFVPGSAPLPGSIATPERASPEPESPSAAEPAAPEPAASSTDAVPPRDDAAPEGSVAPADTAAPEDSVAPADTAAPEDAASPDDDATDDDPATLYIIGTPHGPPPRGSGVDEAVPEPGKQPPTIPLDPRVHWIR